MKTAPPTEEELLRFLQTPASYGHHPASIRIVQTHASFVALASPHVFKVKKPVDFGFLDFSTLAKRKHFCEQEVTLNQRLCAHIYEGVVPIRRQDGELSFEGDGPAVEYAVKMRELAPEGFLNRLLEQHTAGRNELDRIVGTLVSFYRSQHPTPEIIQWGQVQKLKVSTEENFAQTEPFIDTLLPVTSFEAVRHYTESFYTHRRDLLARRCEGGHILDCHGDLHTEHIHLSPERVCIYDCIEFNERFRYIDVASDLAFLAMDLRFNGHPELARYLVRQMARALEDADLLPLIPFYACYRAYVRGKVALMRSEETEVPPEDRAASRERARRYFSLALDYAVTSGVPTVLVVMGRVGTGKSTVAQSLAKGLGWDVVSSDRERKTLAGVALYERADEAERARLYSDEMTSATYARLLDRALDHGRNGHSVILDATYSRKHYRNALRQALRREQRACILVELQASDDLVRARLRKRETEDQVLSDARLEDADVLSARYEAPTPDEDPHLISVSTRPTLDETVLSIYRELIDRSLSEAKETSAQANRPTHG